MNKCIFMGRLTRDPEIRYTQSEKPVAVVNYTLAVDRRYKREGEPSADFINFVAYGTAAEFAEKYFKKGTKLLVTARCQTRTYTNNEGKITTRYHKEVTPDMFIKFKDRYFQIVSIINVRERNEMLEIVCTEKLTENPAIEKITLNANDK